MYFASSEENDTRQAGFSEKLGFTSPLKDVDISKTNKEKQNSLTAGRISIYTIRSDASVVGGKTKSAIILLSVLQTRFLQKNKK